MTLKDRFDDILALRDQGLYQAEIGAKLGFSQTHISRTLRNGGISTGRSGIRYTPEVKAEIRKRVAAGVSVRKLSVDLGLNRNSVFAWLRRNGVKPPRGSTKNLNITLKPEIYNRLVQMAGQRPVEYFVADILARSVADLK